ncbi:YhcH/YjgK/YiaL family protein [Mycoplasma sp. Z473B]|uniref:YhcH/YjgK/YiaL family protein n=1 Tax=Mycoplasma sp. Z473B TaxID=3401667 RepID=UPI003AADCFB3
MWRKLWWITWPTHWYSCLLCWGWSNLLRPTTHYTQADILSASKPNDVFYIKAPQYHNQIKLNQGTFALFFPGELHKITFANEQLTNKDKIIIKVKY